MEKAAYQNGGKSRKTLYLIMKDLLKSAAIGEEVSVDIFNGEAGTVTGILEGITSSGITIRIADRQHFYPQAEIILIRRRQPEADVMTSDAEEFLRRTDALLQANRLSIPIQYADTFARFIPYSVNKDFISLFRKKQARGMVRVPPEMKQTILSELELVCRRIGDLERDEILAARAFVHFAARDYTMGLEELLRVCRGSTELEDLYCLLPLACYCADLRQQSLAHYWLSRFFCHFPPLIDEDQEQLTDTVWLYYLQCAVSRNYYEDLQPLLEALFRESPKTALRSVAYMYLLQHAYDMGRLLLREAQFNSELMTIDQFRMHCVHLPTSPFEKEHYGSFYRFHMRMDEILSKEHPLYTAYTDDPGGDLMGFVYEYIPNTGYCRVLGFDTMIYFWHFDSSNTAGSNQSKHLQRELELQMCSMLPVEEEKAVRIRFRALDGKYSNRGYSVTDVQLE